MEHQMIKCYFMELKKRLNKLSTAVNVGNTKDIKSVIC